MKIEATIFRTLLGKVILPAMALLLSTIALPAQTDPLLEHFSVAKDNGKVLLNWVTRPGTTCDGVDVLRSTDSIHFDLLYHIPGICGGPNTAISYSYSDEHPIANFRNYYRLGLGRTDLTSVRSIEIVDLGNSGYQIRPNPVIASSKVYFDNAARENCRLSLISNAGVVVKEWETREEIFELNASDFQPGVYFVRIQDSEGRLKAKGKVLVVH